MEQLPLQLLIDDAVESVPSLIKAKGQALAVEVPLESIIVHVDPIRLTQVLGNLLINAAKYTNDGGRIYISIAAEAHHAVIRVQDNGMGMTQEQLSHLFEMFEQAPAARARSEGGLGVGLAIAKGLVELHSGTIEARSEGPGRGSEFVVRLPLGEATAGS